MTDDHGCGGGSCGSGACGCGSGKTYSLADYFLDKTDEARMQLFMDKLKQKWNETEGKEMDRIVDLLIKAKSGNGVDKEKLLEEIEKFMKG